MKVGFLKALRILLILILCAAAATPVVSKWLSASTGGKFDEKGFFYEFLWSVNEDRQLAGRTDLIEDVSLQQWVFRQVNLAVNTDDLDTDAILKRLQAQVPSVASASIFVVYSRNEEELREKLVEWGRNGEDEHTHIAARLFRTPNQRGIGSLALMVQRLPQFRPQLLSDQVDAFYNVCPICDEPHLGRVTPASRSIVLECPKCNSKYDLLAVDMKGRYHRVNEFLTGQEPPTMGRKAPAEVPNRQEELFSIWKEVLKHCRYVEDFNGIYGRRDAWQFANETHRYRNGDCEDTSILLADWLITRGFDARVALGRTDRFEGHAWCVVRIGEEQYILETTEAKPDPSMPPTAGNLARRYHPEFLFNREKIYFRSSDSWTADYWSEREWTGVVYGEQTAPEVAMRPADSPIGQ